MSYKRLARVARWIGSAALALLVLYWIAVHVLIKTRALSKIIMKASSEVQAMELTNAWSPYPGRVFVDHFHMKFEDSALQFQLDVRDVDVQVKILRLLFREFSTSHVNGQVEFRLANKIENVSENKKRLAAYPRIDGLKHPPLRTVPPGPDEDPDTWTVKLEDIRVRPRTLWLMEYHYVGDGELSGNLLIQPMRRLKVTDARWRLEQSEIRLGKEQPVVRSLSGELNATLFEHDPDGLSKDESVLDYLKAGLDLHAKGIEIPRALRLYMNDPSPQVETSGTSLEVSAKIDHGKLESGGKLLLRFDKIVATVEPIRVSAPIEIEATTTDGGTVNGILRSKSIGFSTKSDSKNHASPSLRNVTVNATATANHIAKDWNVGRSRVRIERLAVPSLSWLNGPLDTRRFQSGSAEGQLDVARSPTGKLEGNVDLGVQRARFTLSGSTITVTGSVKAAENAKQKDGNYEIERVAIKLDDIAIGTDEERKHWWFTAVSHNASVGTDGSIQATFDIGAQTLEPLIPLFIEAKILQAAARGVLQLGDTDGTVVLNRSDSSFRVDIQKFSSGNLSAHGLLVQSNGTTCGAFLIDSPIAQVGVQLPASGDVSVSPFVRDKWLPPRLARPCRPPD